MLQIATLGAILHGTAAFAKDPLNSDDRDGAHAPPAPKTDVNVVPVVGGDSDVGIGGGAFAGFSRLQRGEEPYLWNVESAALFTFKPWAQGGAVSPYQDVYAKLTVPRLFGAPLRLELRPSYTWERTLGYYGVGNASVDATPSGVPRSHYEYARLHPAIDVKVRGRIVDHVAASTGVRFTYDGVEVDPASKLGEDMRSPDHDVRRWTATPSRHAVALFSYALRWDDRDSEASAHRGSFHELTLEASPGGAGDVFPYRYGDANLTTRAYVPVVPGRVTLALRAVGDVLFGSPPFYELARFDDTYAIGGVNGVRGVPAQRYAGKVKVFGNVELRSEIAPFRAFGKPLRLGAAAFFDAGRVWADLAPHPELDGTGLGLKYGVGAGLRVYSGSTFVLRGDLAWSPDASPVGAYLATGEIF